MIKIVKFNSFAFITALLLGGAVGLTNCSSAATNNIAVTKTNAENTAVVVNSKTTNTTTDVAKTDATAKNNRVLFRQCRELPEFAVRFAGRSFSECRRPK